MDYLKCLAVGVFLAFAGGLAWIIHLLFSKGASDASMSGAVSYDICSFVDERFLLTVPRVFTWVLH